MSCQSIEKSKTPETAVQRNRAIRRRYFDRLGYPSLSCSSASLNSVSPSSGTIPTPPLNAKPAKSAHRLYRRYPLTEIINQLNNPPTNWPILKRPYLAEVQAPNDTTRFTGFGFADDGHTNFQNWHGIRHGMGSTSCSSLHKLAVSRAV